MKKILGSLLAAALLAGIASAQTPAPVKPDIAIVRVAVEDAPVASLDAEIKELTAALVEIGFNVKTTRPKQNDADEYVIVLAGVPSKADDGSPATAIGETILRHVKGFNFPFTLASASINLQTTDEAIHSDTVSLVQILAQVDQFVSQHDGVFEKNASVQ